MTQIQPTDGANITVDSTDLATDGQRNLQVRIQAFISEVATLKAKIKADSDDYMALLRDFEAEKELRTNAQIDRDALQAKLVVHRELLQRVLDADANCTGDAYAALIEDVKAALEVQS